MYNELFLLFEQKKTVSLSYLDFYVFNISGDFKICDT